MKEAPCPHCGGPARLERDNINIQLRYLAHAITNACHDENMTEEDYCALGLFLHDFAERIFPKPQEGGAA